MLSIFTKMFSENHSSTPVRINEKQHKNTSYFTECQVSPVPKAFGIIVSMTFLRGLCELRTKASLGRAWQTTKQLETSWRA